MNIGQLKNQIVKLKDFQSFYIFTGEEIGIMNIYIQQISKFSDKQVCRADSFKEVFAKIKSSALLNKSSIYVLRDDKDLVENEDIWKFLEEDFLESNIIILLLTNTDKRTKFYKKFKDDIVEFEHLDDKLLTKYIQTKLPLSDKRCLQLIEICEHNYDRIMLELDKVIAYGEYLIDTGYRDVDYNDLLHEFIEDGDIYKPSKDAIFDWVKSVFLSPEKVIFELMEECFDYGEAVLPMLTVLYNNIKYTLQVQSCGNGGNISKSTGLTGWQIQCVKDYVGQFSEDQLLKGMEVTRDMEVGIKTGKIEDKLAIPYVLVSLLS